MFLIVLATEAKNTKIYFDLRNFVEERGGGNEAGLS